MIISQPLYSISSSSSWCTLLHNEFSSGNEGGCLLQLLSAATELGSQWSFSWQYILSCRLLKGDFSGEHAPRFDLLDHIWAGWRRHQLQLSVHVVVQSVVTCVREQPHQGNMLLSRQQVVVIPDGSRPWS